MKIAAWLIVVVPFALPVSAQTTSKDDLPSEVTGEAPPAVRADRATEDAIDTDATSVPQPPTTAAKEAENQRAVSGCLTGRGLPAETCRQRRPNQDVPMSRAESRRLEQRYQTRPLGTSRSGYPASGRGAGRGR